MTTKQNCQYHLEEVIEKLHYFFCDKYIQISLAGSRLPQKLELDAKKMGIKNINKLRMLAVSENDLYQKYHPCNITGLSNIVKPRPNRCLGISFKYGLIINKDAINDKKLWGQLFRYVTYYECFGSINNFLKIYTLYVLSFGWQGNPFEKDAQYIAKVYESFD